MIYQLGRALVLGGVLLLGAMAFVSIMTAAALKITAKRRRAGYGVWPKKWMQVRK